VIRFTAPETGGWHRQIGERSSFVYPLILWTTGARVLRSLCAFWMPRWPKNLSVGGHPVRWLCLREAWLEAGRASLCGYRLYYECLRGMLSKGSWKYLISFYENQPWEKLQVLAARAAGIKTVGIQGSLFSRFYLAHALGKGEEERLPLPDLLGSSGEAARKIWVESGFPPASLKLCGALRYPDLAQRLLNRESSPPQNGERSRILVVLPIDPDLIRHLLGALGSAFPDGGAKEKIRFLIRRHPVYPVPRSWIPFPAELARTTSTNLRQDLASCGVVLFAGSTVGLEALAEGKVVLRYRSPRLFDLDDSYGNLLPVVSDSDLREQLLAHVRGELPPCNQEEAARLVSDYFSPVDREQLMTLFHDKI
jgi:surface carbohydrate biosynthesis protein (TIGR04326 family)